MKSSSAWKWYWSSVKSSVENSSQSVLFQIIFLDDFSEIDYRKFIQFYGRLVNNLLNLKCSSILNIFVLQLENEKGIRKFDKKLMKA